ncbi:MAG: 50S ribosomal protein L6 [Chloroflexi bacterium]|nr:50S ribosomal protein L6 [Chloroflexota bacterium]
MSRIGRQPIGVPSGVTVSISGNDVSVKGPKGEMKRHLHDMVSVKMSDGKVIVEPLGASKLHRSLHGLSRTLVANMVDGVSKGFDKSLEVSGVGYRVQKAGEAITLQVGFTRPVTFEPPKGIAFAIEGTNRLKVQGVDKELVGATAASIRMLRLRDPYKAKGIKYVGERVQVKAGKGGKATATKK